MNELKLSDRLYTVAREVSVGDRIADIGSDHAYLPCYLCLKNRIPSAIAGEVVEGPFESALSQVKALGLEDRISVRKGDGLEVLSPGEVDVIVIAGMGGKLIRDILERGQGKLTGVKKLILQPNVGSEVLRYWLSENGWELRKETILEEDGKIYEVLVSLRGDGNAPYRDTGEVGYEFGPFLLKEKNEVFVKKWREEIKKWQYILDQMDKAAESEEVNRRKEKLKEKIEETEAIVNGENS